MEGHHILTFFQPVEDYHLSAYQFVHDQIAHVGVEGHDGGGVGEHDLLGNGPVFREAHVEVSHLLHSVQLCHHPLGLVLLLQGQKFFGGDGLLIQNLNIDVLGRVGGKVVFLLALFKQQQKGLLPGVEPGILQSFLDKFCFSGIQEAGKGVNRNLLHTYTPNSWAMACSSSLEPMTHSLPVISGLPRRTLVSSGT